MSDNKIGPGSTQPPVQYETGQPQAEDAAQPKAQKYIQSNQQTSAPAKKSIFSRAVGKAPDKGELKQERLETLVALAAGKSDSGLASGLANYVKTLDQFHQLMEKLPAELSTDTVKVLADHAGSLTAQEITETLNDTSLPLPDQLDQMGEYMVRIGTPENPVKVITSTRVDSLLEEIDLAPELKAPLRKRVENEALFGLSQRMRATTEQLLLEGSLTTEQEQKMAMQARQIRLELSAYLG